jgi:hypothetical protein
MRRALTIADLHLFDTDERIGEAVLGPARNWTTGVAASLVPTKSDGVEGTWTSGRNVRKARA